MILRSSGQPAAIAAGQGDSGLRSTSDLENRRFRGHAREHGTQSRVLRMVARVPSAHLHTVELSSSKQAKLTPAIDTNQHTVGCGSSNAVLSTAGVNGDGAHPGHMSVRYSPKR